MYINAWRRLVGGTASVGICLGLIAGIAVLAQEFHAEVDLVQVECSASMDGRPVVDSAPRGFRVARQRKASPNRASVAGDGSSVEPWVDRRCKRKSIGLHQSAPANAHAVPTAGASPGRRAMLITRAGDVKLVADLTSSIDRLQEGVDRWELAHLRVPCSPIVRLDAGLS